MRGDRDYSKYDPDNFASDHPDDPVLAGAKESAQALTERLEASPLEGSPWEQRVQVEQAFDQLESERWDTQQAKNEVALSDHLASFANEKSDAVYQAAFERVQQAQTSEGQIAAWEGAPREAAEARSTAAQDPEYLSERQQLEQYQAAQAEAASRESYAAQQEFLQRKGLDAAEPPSREQSTALSAYDRVASGASSEASNRSNEHEMD